MLPGYQRLEKTFNDVDDETARPGALLRQPAHQCGVNDPDAPLGEQEVAVPITGPLFR